MSYEAWRITYQDGEQAARAAYAQLTQLNDQAKTLQVVAIKLGVKAGSEAVRTVPEAVLALIAERDKLLDGYPEGMTPADVAKLKDANAGLAAQLSAIENMPEERKPTPAADYEGLLRQFHALCTLNSARWKQVKYYRDRDAEAPHAAALAGSSEINSQRATNQQLTDQLLATEDERDELRARLDHITEHATHAARSQLCRELAELFDSDQIITVEQVVDLIAAPEGQSDAA